MFFPERIKLALPLFRLDFYTALCLGNHVVEGFFVLCAEFGERLRRYVDLPRAFINLLQIFKNFLGNFAKSNHFLLDNFAACKHFVRADFYFLRYVGHVFYSFHYLRVAFRLLMHRAHYDGFLLANSCCHCRHV